MKLKFIIGILALLLLLIGTASAETLGNCNYPVALNDVSVDASYSTLADGTVTFVVAQVDSAVGNVWFKDVGLPTEVSVADSGAVTDGSGTPLSYTVSEKTMAGYLVVKVALPGGANEGASTVKVKFSGTLPSDPFFIAHACWQNAIPGQYDSNGAQLTSAMFSSGGNPPTQVPEFPTMALPVAAILGLMFIFGLRKQE